MAWLQLNFSFEKLYETLESFFYHICKYLKSV